VQRLAPGCAFTGRHGTQVSTGGIELETFGTAEAPVVVVLGGISASRHIASHAGNAAPGWWEPFVGEGRAVDPRRFRALGVDYAAPEDGPVDTADQAELLALALDQLGVRIVHAIIGASYGGMVALAFAALHPERVGRLVVIGAAHESHPMATAVRVVQRRIVRLGIAAGRPAEGLGIARALAVTTYRTSDEFAGRFPGPPALAQGGARFPVEDYLDHHAERFTATHSPERFLSLSESIDLHRVDPAAVTVPATLVTVTRDTLVPPRQMRELHTGLSGPAQLIEIDSLYGHDAFLKEVAALTPIVSHALLNGAAHA
jgi:homoserine O-acetyltransferase